MPLNNTKDIAYRIKSGSRRANILELEATKDSITKNNSAIEQFITNSKIENAPDLKSLMSILSGESGTEGLIGNLIQQRGQAIPENTDAAPIHELPIKLITAINLDETLKNDIEILERSASAVDFQKLFEAIISLESRPENNTDFCPACSTPLKDTIKDPYKTARTETESMKELIKLQEKILSQAKSLILVQSEINELISKINYLNDSHGKLFQPIIPITSITYEGIKSISSWRKQAKASLDNIPSDKSHFAHLLTKITENNTFLGSARIELADIELHLTKLQALKDACISLQNEHSTLQNTKAKLETEILTFENENEATLEEISVEQTTTTENLAYKNAYTALTSKLRAYRETLPTQLAEGLAAKAIEFYNIINGHDPAFERITSLQLPKVSGEKILIKFNGDNKEYDALQILSEGHIKGLGLSLLLSKITHEKLNFIIYDDIVNAIDDDHRDGIAELMIRHEDIKDKQQIITCHGELFMIKLLNKLGASSASKLVRQYCFTPADAIEERGVRLSIGNSTHYLSRANQYLKDNNIKETLTNCRRACEGITDNIWKDCARTLKTEVTVKIRRPGDKPDLPSTIDGLIKIIASGVFDSGPDLISNLQHIKDRFINYLINKGTHHDDDISEFERSDAIALIANLELTETNYLLFSLEARAREKSLK